MSEHSPLLLELVSEAQLRSIEYFELTAKRDPSRSDDPANEGDPALQPEYTLAIDMGQDRTTFRLRLRIALATPRGTIEVEAAAEYTAGDFPPGDLTPTLLAEYANEVGVMAVLPYLRQAIADLTQRVFGASLLMPIIPRGTLAFSVDSA